MIQLFMGLVIHHLLLIHYQYKFVNEGYIWFYTPRNIPSPVQHIFLSPDNGYFLHMHLHLISPIFSTIHLLHLALRYKRQLQEEDFN